MEKRIFHVQINEAVYEYEEGIQYRQIANDFQMQYEHDIVGVFVNDKLEELHKKLKADCTIRFVTTAEVIGYKTYERSMCLMMVKAIFLGKSFLLNISNIWETASS